MKWFDHNHKMLPSRCSSPFYMSSILFILNRVCLIFLCRFTMTCRCLAVVVNSRMSVCLVGNVLEKCCVNPIKCVWKYSWISLSKLLVYAGINIFLDGFVPTENLRFRETSLVFKVSETAAEEEIKRMCRYDYGHMVKSLGEWKWMHTFACMHTHKDYI